MDIQYNEPQGGGLYIIWLSETHYYGGRTTSFKRRWRTHLRHLLSGTHNAHAQNVFNKYGVFKPQVLQLLDRDEHVEAEQEWLDANYRKEGCVNISPHATGMAPPNMHARVHARERASVHARACAHVGTRTRARAHKRAREREIYSARAAVDGNGPDARGWATAEAPHALCARG